MDKPDFKVVQDETLTIFTDKPLDFVEFTERLKSIGYIIEIIEDLGFILIRETVTMKGFFLTDYNFDGMKELNEKGKVVLTKLKD